MSLQDNFSERLSKILDRRGITQKELAEEIGRSKPLVSFWMTGKRAPRLDDIENVADELGIEAEYLIGGNEPCHSCKVLRKEINRVFSDVVG